MTTDPVQLSRDVIRACLGIGFTDAGVCTAEPSSFEREYREWIAAGRHGAMPWLAERIDVRLDPRTLIEGDRPARSLILVSHQYADRDGGRDPEFDSAAAQFPGEPLGRIARYARGPDYHEIIRRRLRSLADRLRERFPGEEFRVFTDTAPVLEREHAARAGLGWIGRHTLLIDPRAGSYLALGGVATTLHLEPPPEQRQIDDRCGTCTRCIDACPTRAITPYSVDARLCISALTIEQAEPIDPALAPAIGDRLLGCDVCQEVCPWNTPARPLDLVESAASPPVREAAAAYFGRSARRRPALPAAEVASWTAGDRAAALSHSAVKRATLEMLWRNAGIVLANALGKRTSPPPARGA